jgi:F-type H+-transporting ATPase subunit gamma
MPSLRDIKRRIESVKSTQKITRAMKMVAAARLRRAQDAVVRTRPYALRMRDMVQRLALRAQSEGHPLLRLPEGGRVSILAVTTERGLCGGLNSNVVNRLMTEVNTTFAGREVEVSVLGRKGLDALKRRPVELRSSHTGLDEREALRVAEEVVGGIADDFAEGRVGEVYCLYNLFRSAISQVVTLERLLPFEIPDPGEDADTRDYVYEPSVEVVIDTVFRRHLQVQVHRIIQEAAASEHGARMTAMDSATNNAQDVIERLTLRYNRVRQDAITKEMIEIVGGAEAL